MPGMEASSGGESQQGPTVRLDALMQSSRWNGPLDDLKCLKCGCTHRAPGDKMVDMFEWESFADTVIVTIQIFKQILQPKGFVTHTKEERKVLCPQYIWIQKSLYELRGMVCHIGKSCMVGHYIALVKSKHDQRWYICDDDTVAPWQGDTVGKGSFSSVMGGATPYILFFRRAGKDLQVRGEEMNGNDKKQSGGATPRNNDSPETRGTAANLRITPKRRQHFPPQACKLCGMNACTGECTQRF